MLNRHFILNLLLLGLLMTSASALAEFKVYRGDSTSWNNICLTYKDCKLYRGDSTSWNNIIITFSAEPSESFILGFAFEFLRLECTK